jgi:hypothetical protein
MAKHKETKKSTKEVKKTKATIELLEPSDATNTILSIAKRAGAVAKQTTRGCIRVKINDTPILRITGITKDVPNVEIKPKLRTVVADGKRPPAEFTDATGLKILKNWESRFNGSNYLYTGETFEGLEKTMRVFFSKGAKKLASLGQ